MIKQALIESVQKRLQQHDKTGRYHDRLVEAYITLATNTILRNVVDLDYYAKTYENVAVEHDALTNKYYSLYPVPIVQTIDIQKGVRSINTMEGEAMEFAPVTGNDMSLISGMGVFEDSFITGYLPLRERVVYLGEPLFDDGEDGTPVTEVKMNLIVPFSEYGKNEDYPVPGASDLELFDLVSQLMSTIPPKDLLNDNKDNVQTQTRAQ